MPSVDRVGRQFPLTFAASFAPSAETLGRWWSELIAVALRSREHDCDADALESALLTPPGDPWSSQSVELPDPWLVEALAAAIPGNSLWWSWRPGGTDDQTVWLLNGLPRGDQFLRLIRPASRVTGD